MSLLTMDNKTPAYVNTSFSAVTVGDSITFDYPTDSRYGDLIIAHITSENRILPNVPTGWTTVYSNTTTDATGPATARLLISNIRGEDTSATVNVSGGGNVICTALRNFLNVINPNTQFSVNSTSSRASSYTVANTRQMYVVMVSHDGGNTASPTINISTTVGAPSPGANVIYSYNNSTPFRAMAMAYCLTEATSNTVNVNMSADKAWGVEFYVSAT